MASPWVRKLKSFRLVGYTSLQTEDFEDSEKDHGLKQHLVPNGESTSSVSSPSVSNAHYEDEEERPMKYRSPWYARKRNAAYRKVSTYSPILDDIEVPFVNKQVQGGLFPAENTQDQLLGRLEPGPQTDELWLDYEIQRPFVLTRDQVIALGKDPEKTVKYPDDVFGLGPEAYMGGMDAFHVLHCFNTIRKEAFKDYYFDGEQYHMEGYGEESRPKRRHAELFWIHLRHCTDIIVQFLMCNADTTMTTMTWLETQERPWPDFSVNKKCVDFDTLVRWRDENAVDIQKAGRVRRPPGAPVTRIGEMYWKIVGNDTNPGDNRHHPIWD